MQERLLRNLVKPTNRGERTEGMRLDSQKEKKQTRPWCRKETNNWIRLGTINAAGITTMYTIYTLHKPTPTPTTAPWRLIDTSM